MPRYPGRSRRGTSRRRPTPAVRIHTAGQRTESSSQQSTAHSNPLDAYATIQPTDLVPRSTGSAPPGPPSLAVVDDGGSVVEEPSLEEYIQRIEASAARLRAERSDQSGVRQKRPRPLAADAERVPKRRRLRRRMAAAAPAADKPWFRRRKNWFFVGMIIPLLFVAGATAYVLNIVRVSVDAYGDIHQEPVDRTRWTVNPEGSPVPLPTAQVNAVLPDWANDDPINIVLLGVDASTDEDQPPRSDTTIVVHIDPGIEEVAMMSIPRDLMVFIPGYGRDKFNAAYPIGEANADEIPGGGPTLVAQTIEANFNIPIHYFATVDFDGFRQVVDTVGGVVIDVDTHLSDNLYPTDDLRLTRIYFPTGLQKMDGDTALEYVRTRHADSDLGRVERQQQVLMAIREQAISLDLITRAQSLIRDMQDTVRTDLNFNEMLALANLGRQVEADDIARLNLWEEGWLVEHLPDFDGDAYYLEADWEAVLSETRAHFGGDPPLAAEATTTSQEERPDYSVSVFVENATDIPLLAGTSAQLLVDAGYVEVWPSDARTNQTETTIQVSPGQVETARHIANLLGVPSSTILTVSGSDGITIILGSDVPANLIPDPDSESVAG
ncbi:hypothetical protein BH23CHL2_BH23CHL2_36620 [soil metagenome]